MNTVVKNGQQERGAFTGKEEAGLGMSALPAPCGVVTLTTDFGLTAPFVGVMKGVILARFPAARIVDLSHEARAYWPAEAGFWLARCARYFPAGTVHVAVVDPGVGTARGILAASTQGQLFLAPDNGLLGLVLTAQPQGLVMRVSDTAATRFGLLPRSSTFHGRDLFAPIAAALAAGRCALTDLGEPATTWQPFPLAQPAMGQTVEQAAGVEGAVRVVSGVVISIDRYGNLISNIDAALVGGASRPQVQVADRLLPLLGTYGEARPGEMLALINSFGVVEVACREGNAAQELGLGHGAPLSVRGTAQEGPSGG